MQEIEAELSVKKALESSKAFLNAALANEKATHIEKMSEANINVRLLLKSRMGVDIPICKLVIS